MTKTFFIIPGFKSQATDTAYRWLVSFLKKQKYSVKHVPITWDRCTVTQNAAEFLEYFEMHKTGENYVLGFSYGAVIALITAECTKPKELYLCSLSPDFAEDVEAMPKWLRTYIGKRRFADANTRSGIALAKALKVRTTIFYGEGEGVEYPPLKKRCENTAKLAQQATLVIVPDAPHKIDFPAYQEAIKAHIASCK
jgi:pimeloyl-ACP methyl ester carboxylesterase